MSSIFNLAKRLEWRLRIWFVNLVNVIANVDLTSCESANSASFMKLRMSCRETFESAIL